MVYFIFVNQVFNNDMTKEVMKPLSCNYIDDQSTHCFSVGTFIRT